ncbi:hypothetical protein PF004_g22274 [Phytophthora fragariae]|uniref:Uncharacterized protein n=1 Tax=Phytophthora fragariae TaxID=53985 RepID=A0A6G0N0J5_9STRA|nr:hypothetical protein PF004_g22274 [Phytophthora fragariae]
MVLSAKGTKKRKGDGGQVAPCSHKRKKLKAGSASASAEKTATQGKGATTSPTGKTVRKTGAGKATTCKTSSKAGAGKATAGKIVSKTGAGKATTGKTVSQTGAGKATTGKTASKTGADKATTGKMVSKTGAGKAMNQDASGEIREMEMVQSLVEQQAATIASEQPLSIEEVKQACNALVNMHVRLRKAVISLESRLEEVRADNVKLKQKVEVLETSHAMQENLDKRTVELNQQARVQELERAILAEEKKQHAETVEEDKVAHQAWMRDRDATLSELHGLQRENAKIGIYFETVTEWISKCRNAEREKTDAQNGYNGLQCIRANLEKELKDSRHAEQDLERENADLWLWMRSLDASCDVEIATNKFVSARTAAFQDMSGRERRDFCVAKYEELYPGHGDDLDCQMKAFTYTRNRICHDGVIRDVSHEEFQRKGNDIREMLADLGAGTAPATL